MLEIDPVHDQAVLTILVHAVRLAAASVRSASLRDELEGLACDLEPASAGQPGQLREVPSLP